MNRFLAVLYFVIGIIALTIEIFSITIRSLYESRMFFHNGVFWEEFKYRYNDVRSLRYEDVKGVFLDYWE